MPGRRYRGGKDITNTVGLEAIKRCSRGTSGRPDAINEFFHGFVFLVRKDRRSFGGLNGERLSGCCIETQPYPGIDEHVDQQEEIGGTAARNSRDRVDVGFRRNLHDLADGRDDFGGQRSLCIACLLIGVQARYALAYQCRLIRHDADNGDISAEPGLDVVAANARRD